MYKIDNGGSPKDKGQVTNAYCKDGTGNQMYAISTTLVPSEVLFF
jgi:hypothetical protein